MKLKFGVDQAACFRKGVDAPTSTTLIEVNPAEVPAELRAIIGDYLRGIEVHRLAFSYKNVDDSPSGLVVRPYGAFYKDYRPNLLVVPGTTFEDLVAAVLANEQILEHQWPVESDVVWTREAWQEQLAARRRDVAPIVRNVVANLR